MRKLWVLQGWLLLLCYMLHKKIKLCILSVTSCSKAVLSVIDWGTRVRLFACRTIWCESYLYYCYILEQASSVWEWLHLSLWTYFLTSCNFGVSLPIPLSSVYLAHIVGTLQKVLHVARQCTDWQYSSSLWVRVHAFYFSLVHLILDFYALCLEKVLENFSSLYCK